MQYSTNADGDDIVGTDDEDGVIFVGGNTLMVNTGEQVILSWSTTLNDGHINGWIDFNGDGNFDTNERVITDHLIGSGSGNAVGNKTFNYIVPADAVCGTSYARFLIADNNISHSPTGSYQYGEVEDYKVVIDGCGGDIIPPSDPTCDENTSLLWENNIVINDCNVSFDVRFVNGQTTNIQYRHHIHQHLMAR